VPSDPPSRDDGELLEAAWGGDEDAFIEIYRRHKDRVYRFAHRMTGSAETARDVTHSCFAALLEGRGRYDRRLSSLATYLCAAARNQSLRHAQRGWREPPLVGTDPRSGQEPDPLETLLRSERSQRVREALASLAPLHREVLILAEYEELDMATIAEIVGADVGAVKVRLHRARRKLRSVLEPFMRSAAKVG